MRVSIGILLFFGFASALHSQAGRSITFPISTKYLDELPSCRPVDESGTVIPLRTRFSKQSLPFEEIGNIERRYPGNHCVAQAFSALVNIEQQARIQSTAIFLKRIREIALTSAKHQIDRIQEIQECLSIAAPKNIPAETCEYYRKNFVELVQRKTKEMRSLLSIAQSDSCPHDFSDKGQYDNKPHCASKADIYRPKGISGWLDELLGGIKDFSIDPLQPGYHEMPGEQDQVVTQFKDKVLKVIHEKKIAYTRTSEGMIDYRRAQLRYDSFNNPNDPKTKEYIEYLRGRITKQIEGQVNVGIQDLKAKAREDYKTLIDQFPILRFISKANPTQDDVLGALGKLKPIAYQVQDKIEKTKLDHVGKYREALNLALQEMSFDQRGDFCEIATQQLEYLNKKKVAPLVLGIAGTVASGGLGAPAAFATGVLMTAAFGYQALRECQNETVLCSGAVNRSGPACDLNQKNESCSNYETAVALAPFAVLGGGQAVKSWQFHLKLARLRQEANTLLKTAKLAVDKKTFIASTKKLIRSKIDELAPEFSSDKSIKLSREVLIKALGKATEPEELASLYHQTGLIKVALGNMVKELGADPGSLMLGMVVSDLGKLRYYKNILAGIPEEGTFLATSGAGHLPRKTVDLYKCLQLDSTCNADVLKALEDYMGRAGFIDQNGKPLALINPQMSHERIANIFREMPIDVGLNHELPGIGVLIDALQEGRISPHQFQRALHANLFHNGPANEGSFWGFASNQLRPGIAAKVAAKNPDVEHLHDGSIYAALERGVYRPDYKTPRPVKLVNERGEEYYDFSNIAHTIADRAEGLYSGSTKFFFEMKFSPMPLDAMVNDLLKQNSTKTGTQFKAISKMLDEEIKVGRAGYAGKKELSALKLLKSRNDAAQAEAIQIQKFMERNIISKQVSTPKGMKSVKEIRFVDTVGRDVVVQVDETTVTVQRGYQRTQVAGLGQMEKPDLIEKVLAPLVDELLAWQRTNSSVGNILEILK